MKKESPVNIVSTTPTEAPMTLDTAAELAQNLVTKFAVPLMRIEEIVRVAKDNKNLVAAYEKQIPEFEGRLAALRIEETAATARAANATARAADAEKTADGVAQDAARRAATARDSLAVQIADIERDMAIRRERLEADYTARKATLDGLLAAGQQQLDALTNDYERLLETARSKFSA